MQPGIINERKLQDRSIHKLRGADPNQTQDALNTKILDNIKGHENKDFETLEVLFHKVMISGMDDLKVE